ncbi:MAG: response regulator [Schleiferiaceae bacterium]|nr:response regulator [Schleiferiaceae bacterium]
MNVTDNLKIGLLEDETIVIRDLKARLEHMGYDVVAACASGEEFLTAVKNTPMQLCLVDINLRGQLSGIETMQLMQKTKNIPVIYLTAQGDAKTFDKAKETNPSAYLLKPYNEFEIRAAIELAINNFEEINAAGDEKDFKVIEDKIFFKYKNRFERVKVLDIIYLEASGNYTELHVEGGKCYLLVQQLGKFESIFKEEFMYRCHRSFIVNLHKVDGFDDVSIYIGEKYIPISKAHKKEFLDRLRII